MAVQNLHEAAAAVERIYEAVDELLQATAPMQMEYLEERGALDDLNFDGLDEVWERSGYRAFWSAVNDLIELLQTVDEADNADNRRRILGS